MKSHKLFITKHADIDRIKNQSSKFIFYSFLAKQAGYVMLVDWLHNATDHYKESETKELFIKQLRSMRTLQSCLSGVFLKNVIR